MRFSLLVFFLLLLSKTRKFFFRLSSTWFIFWALMAVSECLNPVFIQMILKNPLHKVLDRVSGNPNLVVIVSFTLVISLYMALGFMGAKLFGPGVDPQVTLSMPPHLIVSKIALWATVITPMTKYALAFTPFAIQIEQKLPPSMKTRTKMMVRGSVGSALLLTILSLALSVPYFQHVLSLTGSVVSIAICIILPCTFYTKIFYHKLTKSFLVLNLVLIVFGLVIGGFGSISSSRLLVKTLRGGLQHS